MKLLTSTYDKWNINCVNDGGETPLMYAAREGNVAIIKYMSETFVDPDDSTSKSNLIVDQLSKDSWTAFFFACTNGWLITADFLHRSCGAQCNLLDKFNRNVLHWSARYNNDKMVQILLQFGVNQSQQDLDGLTPAELAKMHKNDESLAFLQRAKMTGGGAGRGQAKGGAVSR